MFFVSVFGQRERSHETYECLISRPYPTRLLKQILYLILFNPAPSIGDYQIYLI